MSRQSIVSFALIVSILLTTINISNVYARYTFDELKQIAEDSARSYGVEDKLIFAIIQQESGWQDKVVSNAKAIGVMQVIPPTGKDACGLTREELFDAKKNIDCGVKYFSQQLKDFNGDIKLALCAYNAGPNRAVKGINRCNRIKETRNYIKNVLSIWDSGTEYLKIPDNFVDSAKTIADNHFIYGNYQDYSKWWGLVCEAVDKVYYKKLGGKKLAITSSQQKLWRRILSATVSDIYADLKRLGQQSKWPKKRLWSKIIGSCPKNWQNNGQQNKPPFSKSSVNQNNSTIDIANNWFEQKSGYKSTSDWWKLLCKAIDEVYYKKTSIQITITKVQKKVWWNILDATVDEFYTNEVSQGNNSWSKERIKSKIIDSCSK